jgi:hypothetical protein
LLLGIFVVGAAVNRPAAGTIIIRAHSWQASVIHMPASRKGRHRLILIAFYQ